MADEITHQDLTFSLDLDDWIAIKNGLANSSRKSDATQARIQKILAAINQGYKVTVTVIPF
jgi:hypothetical protein